LPKFLGAVADDFASAEFGIGQSFKIIILKMHSFADRMFEFPTMMLIARIEGYQPIDIIAVIESVHDLGKIQLLVGDADKAAFGGIDHGAVDILGKHILKHLFGFPALFGRDDPMVKKTDRNHDRGEQAKFGDQFQ